MAGAHRFYTESSLEPTLTSQHSRFVVPRYQLLIRVGWLRLRAHATPHHLSPVPPSPQLSPPRQLARLGAACQSRSGRGRRSRSVPSPDAHWRWDGACNVFGCTHPRQPQAGPSWASSATSRHCDEPPRFERSKAVACERSTPCYRTTNGPSTPLGDVHWLLLPVTRAAGRRTRRASEP